MLIGMFGLSLVLAKDFQISEEALQEIEAEYGIGARERLTGWATLISTAQSLPDIEKLEKVNRFFNKLHFTTDQLQWGEQDYWATPIEFLSTGGGDCEDFSIAKYFTLKELGVDESKLRITYVKAMKINQAHMVLTYYEKPYSEPLVLDNLDDEIKPGSKRLDLKPVYSFNGDGLWLAKERGRGKRVSNSDQINLWADVAERMSKGLNKK